MAESSKYSWAWAAIPILIFGGYRVLTGSSLTRDIAKQVSSGSSQTSNAAKQKNEKSEKQVWIDYYETGECQDNLKRKSHNDAAFTRARRELGSDFEKIMTSASDAYCQCVSTSRADGANIAETMNACKPLVQSTMRKEAYGLGYSVDPSISTEINFSDRAASEEEAIPPNAHAQHNQDIGNYASSDLQKSAPTTEEINSFLQTWLDKKATVLRGEASAKEALHTVARQGLINQVRQQRSADQSAGLTQKVEASIDFIRVISRTSNRIELRADVDYRDQTLNAAGTVVNSTAPRSIKVAFILERDEDGWRLQSYAPV